MTRNDAIRGIASHARSSHVSALFVIGWLAQGASDKELEDCLDSIHRSERELAPDGHLAAYAERWGRVPDSRS